MIPPESERQKIEYQCPVCGHKVDTLWQMMQHYREYHEHDIKRRYIMRLVIPGKNDTEKEIVLGETMMSLEYDANDTRTE